MDNNNTVFEFDGKTYNFNPNINSNETSKFTSLMFLILCCDSTNLDHNKFKEFVLKNKNDINKQNQFGYSALMMACHSTKFDENIIKILINAGCNLNLQTNNNITALMLSIFKKNTNTIKILLNAGANVNISTIYGFTAFSYAIEHNEIMKMLIDAHADMITQYWGESNFDLLCKHRKIEIIKYYLIKKPHLAENQLIQFIIYKQDFELIKLLNELYFMKLAHFKAY